MIIEKASGFSEINLGRQGENQARKVVFDVLRAWREEFGSTGAASLIVQRSEDAAPYPVTLGEENGMLTWTVGAADTAYAGEGKAELRYTVGSTVIKSGIYKTVVRATLGDCTSEPPEGSDPYEGEYEVTPKVYEDTVLATKSKTMRDDVRVRKIPQYEVTNESGGMTLILGDELKES